MLNRYQNKKIKVTTEDGAEFTGIADVFPSGYGLHEFDRAEEGIQLDDVIVFKSDIRRIEKLSDAAADEADARRFDEMMGELLEGPYRIVDILPGQVSADAAAAERLAARITERFFDEQSGLFRLFLGHDEERTSVLGNALAVLCGAADRLDTARIEAVLLANGEGAEGPEAIAATLSMACFRYDALLRLDRTRYREAILQDIDRTGLSMLRSGATSFWETIRGAEDFDGAGSLCHGWSAMPVYYYRTLLEV